MIKIDMEMPKSCISCGRHKWSNYLQVDVCAIDYHIIDFEGKQSSYKSESCPLIECEDEIL
jgi:hypothetical protein